MNCSRCGAADGAHFAFCYPAQLFERVLGKGYPLFPRGVFARPVEPEADLRAERDRLAGELERMRKRAKEAREEANALAYEMSRREAEAQEPAVTTERPWWQDQEWGTPLEREARASVALDGETQSFGPGPDGDITATSPLGEATHPGQVIVHEEDLPPALRPEADEEVSSVPTDPEQLRAHVDAIAAKSQEIQQDLRDSIGMTRKPVPDKEKPAAPQDAAAKRAETAERKTWIDTNRAEVRRLITDIPTITQTQLAELIGISGSTMTNILNGRVYSVTGRAHLERMLQALRAEQATPGPEPHSELVAAVEIFLADRVKTVPGAFVPTAELRTAYEQWRPVIGGPAMTAIQFGQTMFKLGHRAGRRHSKGVQVRGYADLRLRQGAREDASQASDEEPAQEAPATPERERLHPDAERYTRPPAMDELPVGLTRKMVSTILAADAIGGVVSTISPTTAESFLAPQEPIEHPAGWDDVPGRELAHTEVREMARVLVKEQGWGYKRAHGRNGKPKLRTPQGQVYSLPNTPSDYRAAKNSRAGLRRLGARL